MDHGEYDRLTQRILNCAFAVDTELGPGLLESTYQAYLLYQLVKAGLRSAGQVPLVVVYDGQKMLKVGYRMDIVVEDVVVLELKSIEGIAPLHGAQLLSYLRHSRMRVGLLINFNVERLKDGIVRQVNRY